MKSRIIKKVLRSKIYDWLESIEDEEVRAIASKNTIVTGGAIASMLLAEPVNDYDIYFRTRAATLAVAKYYIGRFKPKNRKGIVPDIYLANGEGLSLTSDADVSGDDNATRIKIVIKSAGIVSENGTEKPYEYFETLPEGEGGEYVGDIMSDPGEIQDTLDDTRAAIIANPVDDKPPYRPVFMSTNAITLANSIQLVIRFHGDPEAIHANYDYVHCTNYLTSWDNELVLRPAALEALLAKELRYVGSKYPVCSLFRLRKFIQRGWSVNAGQILKMAMQVSALNLTDPKVLEDQLTGVDAAYFTEVLARIKENNPERINTAYLIEIIDRMF